jgi:hypothetical protein
MAGVNTARTPQEAMSSNLVAARPLAIGTKN